MLFAFAIERLRLRRCLPAITIICFRFRYSFIFAATPLRFHCFRHIFAISFIDAITPDYASASRCRRFLRCQLPISASQLFLQSAFISRHYAIIITFAIAFHAAIDFIAAFDITPPLRHFQPFSPITPFHAITL